LRRNILLIIVFLFFSVLPCQARWGFRHADRNKDGVVDKKEWQMEKRWQHERRIKARNWWQRMADTDGNGIVDENERADWKKLLKERIDLNGDGKIDAKERRLCWRHARSRVNTPLEAKYDKNADGWLQPEEVREFLKDRYTLIKTHGQAKVDTPIEAEYDTNQDGIISSQEAEALKEDLTE